MKNVKKGAEHESLRATVRDCQGVLWYVYFDHDVLELHNKHFGNNTSAADAADSGDD